MPSDAIRIETIDTIDGCAEHVRLQRTIWGQDPPDSVPEHLLIAAARHGGLVLGAYAGDQMVGLLMSMPALHEGRLVHLSHMLGTHPDWRGHGVGAALKWRQRELVLAQGIDLVTWTYDPLEAINARLNLSQLGGTTREYVRDYYGAMDDALNRGVPSDRFVVLWRLNAPRVHERAAGSAPEPDSGDAPLALAAIIVRGLPRPGDFSPPAGPTALIEIPGNIQQIKREQPDLALEWRLATRAAFERLFAAGYVATNLVRRDGRAFYYVEQIPS
jgi:predicted GNAT superfamily acetyltransferase